MTETAVPASVLQFIAKRIDSVTELETLLILRADETRTWSVEEIAARTYVAPAVAAKVLAALRRHRLVSATRDGARFQFHPASDEERQLVAQTAVAYQHHLISIATFIHKKASVPVQEFSRAFKLKKDRE